MKLLPVTCLLAISLAGCATAHDLRARPADISMVANGKYDLIAECVANRSDGLGINPAVLRIDRVTKNAYVFLPLEQTGAAVYDITFFQDGDWVKIDARGMDTIYGSDYHPKQIWPVVTRCATEIKNITNGQAGK